MRRFRPRLTYANVMATIAVFGVLAGGGAYAASKIGPKDIRKNAVRAKHIKKNAVKTPKIANKAVKAPKLGNDAKAMWAAVGTRAEIGAQSGGITVEPRNGGNYIVKFPRSLQGKAIVATPLARETLGSPIGATSVGVTPCGGVLDPESAFCSVFDDTPRDAWVNTWVGPSNIPVAFYVAVLP